MSLLPLVLLLIWEHSLLPSGICVRDIVSLCLWIVIHVCTMLICDCVYVCILLYSYCTLIYIGKSTMCLWVYFFVYAEVTVSKTGSVFVRDTRCLVLMTSVSVVPWVNPSRSGPGILQDYPPTLSP